MTINNLKQKINTIVKRFKIYIYIYCVFYRFNIIMNSKITVKRHYIRNILDLNILFDYPN